MKRILRRAFGALAVSMLAAVTAPACADNDMSVFVQKVLAPPINRQNGQCIYQGDPQAPGSFLGKMDYGVRDDYVAVILYGNQMIQRGDPLQVRVESSRFHLEEAFVTVTETDGTFIHSFTSAANGLAEPQNNNIPSYDIGQVTAIDGQTRTNIINASGARGADRVVISNIKIRGRTLGGTEVESGEFKFPIRVCDGCLVDFSSGTDPAQALPNCAAPLAQGGGGASVVLPCLVGQDETTPCQLCRTRPACIPR